jgi:hypothetical protein
MVTRYLQILGIVERLLDLHAGIVCTYSYGRDNHNQSITTVNTSTVPRWNETIACIFER